MGLLLRPCPHTWGLIWKAKINWIIYVIFKNAMVFKSVQTHVNQSIVSQMHVFVNSVNVFSVFDTRWQ